MFGMDPLPGGRIHEVMTRMDVFSKPSSLASGKRLHNYGNITILVSVNYKWAIFNSYVKLPEGMGVLPIFQTISCF